MSLLQRYKDLGEDFTPQVELRQCLRVNTQKISEKDLIKRLEEKGVTLEKVSYLDHGYFFESPFTMSSCEEYLLGYFYIQEGASQLPVQALLNNFKESSPYVLDMCAAPGSKTTQLVQNLPESATIVALDNHVQRLKVLEHNLERLGISNVISIRKEAQFADDLHKKFDAVLLDAPCSGNFCIEPNYFSNRTLVDIKEKARVQKELLKTAYKVLKSKGVLVYSTCSLEPEEDELIVQWFLEKYPDIKLAPTNIEVGDPGFTNIFSQELDSSLSLTKRIWPHKTGLQGFFIAKFVKN